jgi:hypothetical protein
VGDWGFAIEKNGGEVIVYEILLGCYFGARYSLVGFKTSRG